MFGLVSRSKTASSSPTTALQRDAAPPRSTPARGPPVCQKELTLALLSCTHRSAAGNVQVIGAALIQLHHTLELTIDCSRSLSARYAYAPAQNGS